MCDRKVKDESRMTPRFLRRKQKEELEMPSSQMAKAVDREGLGDQSDQFWTC